MFAAVPDGPLDFPYGYDTHLAGPLRPSVSTRRAGSASTSTRSSTGTRSARRPKWSPSASTSIAVTHGHGDHVGDTVALAQKHSATVVALVELSGLAREPGRRRRLDAALRTRAARSTSTACGSRSRTRSTAAPRRTARTPASRRESSSRSRTARASTSPGDTCVFGDMQLIGRIYEPDVAVLPIGDHYTMGPREAAVALELLGTKRCVPCHWGTFPVLTGTPQTAAGARARRRDDRDDRAGRLGDDLRERWWGRSGRRVPEIALEGDPAVPLDEALVVDDLANLEPLRAAFDAGTPVVVRAASAERIVAALARPEVTCVVVPRRPARAAGDRPDEVDVWLSRSSRRSRSRRATSTRGSGESRSSRSSSPSAPSSRGRSRVSARSRRRRTRTPATAPTGWRCCARDCRPRRSWRDSPRRTRDATSASSASSTARGEARRGPAPAACTGRAAARGPATRRRGTSSSERETVDALAETFESTRGLPLARAAARLSRSRAGRRRRQPRPAVGVAPRRRARRRLRRALRHRRRPARRRPRAPDRGAGAHPRASLPAVRQDPARVVAPRRRRARGRSCASGSPRSATRRVGRSVRPLGRRREPRGAGRRHGGDRPGRARRAARGVAVKTLRLDDVEGIPVLGSLRLEAGSARSASPPSASTRTRRRRPATRSSRTTPNRRSATRRSTPSSRATRCSRWTARRWTRRRARSSSSTTRSAVGDRAEDAGTTVLAIGGVPGRHEISPWEYFFPAYGARATTTPRGRSSRRRSRSSRTSVLAAASPTHPGAPHPRRAQHRVDTARFRPRATRTCVAARPGSRARPQASEWA